MGENATAVKGRSSAPSAAPDGATGDTSPPSIHVLMGKVLAEMPAVGKNSQAPSNMGGYAFRGIEDVLSALKPTMAKLGVFCTPSTIERRDSERSVGQNKTMFVVDLHIVWTFYGPAGDSVTTDAWGCGTDMGDKAPQKAATSAFKTMLGQTFVIGDEATDSERHSVPETEAADTLTPDEKFENWCREQGWEDKAEHDEWRESRLAALKREAEDNPSAIPAITAWREQHGLDWRTGVPKPTADAFDAFMVAGTAETGNPPTHDTAEAGRTCDGCQLLIADDGSCGCPF